MRIARRSGLFLILVLFCTPFLSGQTLSTYRKFSLGTSLAALAKQTGQDPQLANLIHQKPDVIQEMMYWPNRASSYPVTAESVSQILFSFCDRRLYKISVTYDGNATQGLTDDDMVKAISARYGTATSFYPEVALPAHDEYAPAPMAIAGWGDAEVSVILSRSAALDPFTLTISSKGLAAKADAAIAESLRLENADAPQKELDRQKSSADKLETARQKNIKAFRP
jgi:hypothetical protein